MKKFILMAIVATMFTFISFSQTNETFIDSRDGKTYKTVKIGNQIWMAENLAYKPSPGIYWAYGNDSNNVTMYGYLYDWKTACDVCPSGWHLPSDDEWKSLELQLGMSQRKVKQTFWRGTNQGSKLKSTSGWSNNGNGTNSTGFMALQSGYRNSEENFVGLNSHAYWWSDTASRSYAKSRNLHCDMDKIRRSTPKKNSGFSVRCLKD